MTQCPKCKSKKIDVKYIRAASSVPWKNQADNQEQFLRGERFYNDEAVVEHLVYTCLACGYRKAKKTKDSK